MAAAIPLVGAGISAYGSVEQGKMTSDSLNTQAQNLRAQAAESEAQGAYNAQRQQIMAGAKIGSETASFGASGVKANSGSALDVIQASHQNAEMDRLNILHGADIKAINYSNQASMDQYGAESALKGGWMKAIGSLAQGGAQAYLYGMGSTPNQNPLSTNGASVGNGYEDMPADYSNMPGADGVTGGVFP